MRWRKILYWNMRRMPFITIAYHCNVFEDFQINVTFQQTNAPAQCGVPWRWTLRWAFRTISFIQQHSFWLCSHSSFGCVVCCFGLFFANILLTQSLLLLKKAFRLTLTVSPTPLPGRVRQSCTLVDPTWFRWHAMETVRIYILNYPNDSLALLHHRIEYGGMIVFIVHTTIKVYDRSMHLLLLYVSKRKGV